MAGADSEDRFDLIFFFLPNNPEVNHQHD